MIAHKSNAEVCYSCQTCGKRAPVELCPHDDPEAFEESGWELKNILLCEQVLVLMTCLRCARFDAPIVLERYKERIFTGLEVGFH